MRIIASLFIVLLAFCFASCASSNEGNQKVEKSGLIKVIDELPLGTSLADVIKLLNYHKIEYWTYDKEPQVRGIIRDTYSPSSFVSESIQFELFFDEDQKILRKSKKTKLTGM